jgi:hypothetical protein
MRNEAIKTFAPILGGLAIGDGVARIYENNKMIGIPELVFGFITLCYVFYLVIKK